MPKKTEFEYLGEPFTGMGVAGYAMMLGLVTGMVQSGQKESARIVLSNAREWVETRGIKNSIMKEAAERLLKIEQQLDLLGQQTKGVQ